LPESPDELYRRVLEAADADGRLPLPPLEEWDSFPFEGDLRTRPLRPPAEEPSRQGEGGVDCARCATGDADAIWSDEHWLVAPLPRPSGLPVVVLLYPKAHLDLHELPAPRQAELGPLIVRGERAVAAVEGVARVHVGRWGEGSEHLHVWFMGRPARMSQLRSSFAAIWDDILPPVPEDVWRGNLAVVAGALARGGGRSHV
jgi:diadenosine tetraphosphate (Ap4A) HIT family hydrolase